MAKSILAIGSAVGYDKSTNDIIFTSNSLSTAGFDIGLTMDAIRGGLQNATLGFLPHTTSFTVNMEDSLFDMNYVALNCGGAITTTANVMTTETITTSVANTITVTQTPVAMTGATALVGWYKLANSTDDAWTTITFVGKDATTTLASGSTVCVKYFYSNASAREFTINSAIVPSIIRLVVTYTLYATSASGSSSAILGELQVEVPSLQFNGAQSFSISASGASTSPVGGQALVNYTGSCNGGGYYAKVREVITGKDPFANAVAIGVKDGDIDLAVAGTETVQVFAFYNDGTAPSKIDNAELTFTSSNTNATVGAHTGLVTGAIVGESVITIIVTTKTSLSTTANVTVTA